MAVRRVRTAATRVLRDAGVGKREERLVVAVSGGADSMVLLHLLVAGGWIDARRCVVAHVHHGLRGREADADARFVQRTADRWGLRCVCEAVDVRARARAAGQSTEAAGRDLRHAALARVARTAGACRVVLAHHADDQVETFLWRLLRGAGGEGLAGMKPVGPSPADASITLVRPLLGVSRAELRAYARAVGLRWREDSSNRESDALRNRIRRELIPLLERRFQPGLRGVLLRTIDRVGAEADCVRRLAAGWLRRTRRGRFECLPVAVQRAVIEAQLAARGLGVKMSWVEALRGAVGKAVTAAPGRRVCRGANGVIEDCAVELPRFGGEETIVEVRGLRGEARCGRGVLEWEIWLGEGGWPGKRREPGVEWFDADRVGGKVVLRHWRPGDRYQPIGLSRGQKLQDVFVNEKVSREERHVRLVAATAQGEVFWVEGLRIGEVCKVTARTRRWLRWAWRLESSS